DRVDDRVPELLVGDQLDVVREAGELTLARQLRVVQREPEGVEQGEDAEDGEEQEVRRHQEIRHPLEVEAPYSPAAGPRPSGRGVPRRRRELESHGTLSSQI